MDAGWESSRFVKLWWNGFPHLGKVSWYRDLKNKSRWQERKKKSYLKNVLLKWFTFWKQGSLKRMHSRSVGSLYPTKLIRKKIYLNLVYYRPTHWKLSCRSPLKYSYKLTALQVWKKEIDYSMKWGKRCWMTNHVSSTVYSQQSQEITRN